MDARSSTNCTTVSAQPRADTPSPSSSEKGESDKDDDGERRPLLDKDRGKEAETKRGERVKWRSVLVVCVLWFAQVIITSAYSLVAPFFPKEAAEKGANAFITGVIISASAFCLVVFTPLIGYFLPKLGMKFTLVSGMLLVGGGFFLMGFLVDMPAGVVFLVFAILLRMTEGLGWAMCTTTTFSLIAQLFPTRVGTLTGMMEVAAGLGFAIGPPLGGLLYTVGGFRVPFLSVGGVIFLIIPFTILLVKPTSCSSEVLSLITVVKLLSHFSVFVLLLGNMICFFFFTFFEPTFGPFLSDKFGFNQLKVALMFGIIPVVYFVCAMITGRLSDKFGTRQFIISGFFISGVSLFFIGPAPFISTPRVWIIIVGMVILGFGAAQAFVPIYSDLLKQAHTLYPEEDKAVLTSVVSGMAAFSMALGQFTGPLLGGALTQITDFPTTALLVGELTIAQAILLLGVTLIDRRYRRTTILRIY